MWLLSMHNDGQPSGMLWIMEKDRVKALDPAAAASPLYHYTSPDEDSARWQDFPFRQGDIVISSRSKSGTTWMQMICLLLVHQTPDLPGSLGALSPWLDWKVQHREVVWGLLDAQPFRRVIKTHTPLDGVPIDDDVSYIVMGRHPLDMAVSLYHQGDNIDRERMRELTGAPEPEIVAPSDLPAERPPMGQWLRNFVDWDPDPRQQLDSLPGILLHLTDAWERQAEADVVLVHYDDLLHDLDGSMRRLARLLTLPEDESRWPSLVHAATFEYMRSHAAMTVPDAMGILKDPRAFFRSGESGQGRLLLNDEELAHYRARVADLAPADLLAWLHRDDVP
jgi:aryl sulfotransferase